MKQKGKLTKLLQHEYAELSDKRKRGVDGFMIKKMILTARAFPNDRQAELVKHYYEKRKNYQQTFYNWFMYDLADRTKEALKKAKEKRDNPKEMSDEEIDEILNQPLTRDVQDFIDKQVKIEEDKQK